MDHNNHQENYYNRQRHFLMTTNKVNKVSYQTEPQTLVSGLNRIKP